MTGSVAVSVIATCSSWLLAVGEDSVVGHLSEAVRERSEHGDRDVGIAPQHAMEVPAIEYQAENGRGGKDRRRSWVPVEEGHLSEELARPEAGEERSVPSVGRVLAHLDLPIDEEIEPVVIIDD